METVGRAPGRTIDVGKPNESNRTGLATRFVDSGHLYPGHQSAKNLHVEAPVFYVYLPHRPKSALGCASVLVSRFKMKIGSLVPARCRGEKEKQEERKPRTSTSGSWKKKKKPSSRPLTCTFITLYCCRAKHPASRATYRDPPSPPFPSSRRIEIRGSNQCLLSHPERRENLT
ncbi:hypothetical protein ALC62_02599 [Cyphomyrmex costatus]|uniref:Uncharacterized protein n=1 Tax=Cyphomyrmex costatus TaxID=456900 RepID=A0A195D0T2_9HYME|nr:hypothetical protein ALC62_02599 [Cyphomyrmex costatus]